MTLLAAPDADPTLMTGITTVEAGHVPSGTTRDQASTVKYRPDIDGLRAVAIISVLLYHAGWKTFSGGYVGVDIFFVISGYLISSILLRELKSNSFSLARFYERRV